MAGSSLTPPGQRQRVIWLRWLVPVGILAVASGLGALGWLGWSYLTIPLDTRGEVSFDRELRIPPIAPSTIEEGVKVFELEMSPGETDFGQANSTPTWGINGSYLGPTIRASRGETVRIDVTNELNEPTSLHWHGMHLPAKMDGGPHQMIAPGDTWVPEWEIDQPAATLWYHPHPHGRTGMHVYRGLAGMFIVDDEEAHGLPDTYGVDDVPLIVQDRKFHDDGRLDFSHYSFQSAGVTGDTILVNGVPGAYFDVTRQFTRLRVLNASNTRPYNFHFEDYRDFAVVGSDGGLLPASVGTSNLQLSPGERAEIVVRFNPGETVRLQSQHSDSADRIAGGRDRLDIMEFRAGPTLVSGEAPPDELASMPQPDQVPTSRERSFNLSGFSINGRSMDMTRVDLVATAGDSEVWAVTNVDGQTHNFHIHDVQFRIIDINGEAPPAVLAGRKDTVWIPPETTIRLLVTFSDYTSTEFPYMYHCHILRHEDMGMMGQFLVVEPGQSTRPEDYQLSTHNHNMP